MNKKIKILVGVLLIVLVSGCTQYLKNPETKKTVTYEKTGQVVTSNILCKPKDPELLKLYEKNKANLEIPIEKLPECSKFKPSDIKYKGIWESIFVKPLAWTIVTIGNFVKNYGISVMLVGLFIRIILMPISKKSALQTKKMTEINPEMQKIEKKYKDKTDKESMMAKSQETMMLYKKHGVNPMSGCLIAILQLPLFFAFLEAINRVPAIFEEKLLTFQLGTTPMVGISKGNYLYILLVALIIASTYFSMRDALKGNQAMQSDQAKQSKYMMIFMIGFISVASLNLPTAIALYWIVTNTFAAIQNMIVKRNDNK